MLALLYKDLYTMKKYAKTLLAVLVFYLALAFLGQSVNFISSMSVFFFVMIGISSFSYDQYSKWDKYCISLPVSRRQMVGSKYVLTLLLLAFGLVFGMGMGGIVSLWVDISFMEDILFSCLGSGVAVIFMVSILFPLLYRFGVEKSRLLLLAVCFVPVILILAFTKWAQQAGIPMPSEETFLFWFKLAPVGAVLLFIASYFLSVRIFCQKEL